MRTIKVSDEVYAYLQRKATAFEDTPDSVLRRELPIEAASNGNGRPPGKRIARGERTPQEGFRAPLLRVLYEAGGSLKRSEAIDAVGELMKDRLNEVDWQPTKTGRVRWQNYVEFARNGLVEEGFLKTDSSRGVWELTAKGIKAAKEVVE